MKGRAENEALISFLPIQCSFHCLQWATAVHAVTMVVFACWLLISVLNLFYCTNLERDRISFISLMFSSAYYRALNIESTWQMKVDWSIYLPKYTDLCIWGNLHLFLAESSIRVPLTGMCGRNIWQGPAVGMVVIKSSAKTRPASSSATFCRPLDCDLAWQAFAVRGSSRALRLLSPVALSNYTYSLPNMKEAA